jgi:hypothetical protein
MERITRGYGGTPVHTFIQKYIHTHIYACIYTHTYIQTHIIGKAIPLQALTGPEGSKRLRLPDFETIGT